MPETGDPRHPSYLDARKTAAFFSAERAGIVYSRECYLVRRQSSCSFFYGLDVSLITLANGFLNLKSG
jgi:hypothetical protein